MSKKAVIIEMAGEDLVTTNKINTALGEAKGMLSFNRKYPEEEPYPLETIEGRLEEAMNLFDKILGE